MADTAIVGPDIEAGAWLIREIRSVGPDIRAAAWVFDEERDRWRLHIVADWPVGIDGNPYRSLTPLFGLGLNPSPGSVKYSGRLRLEDVVLHSPATQYGRAIERLAAAWPKATRQVRDRYVEGLFFPAAVVYGLAA